MTTEKRVVKACPVCGSTAFRKRTRSHDYKCYECGTVAKEGAPRRVHHPGSSPKFFKTIKEAVACDPA